MTTELWRRILARFRFARTLTRPRVPLVLRRNASAAPARTLAAVGVRSVQARGHRSFHTAHHHVAVHAQLSWPQWLVHVYGAPASTTHLLSERAAGARTAARLSRAERSRIAPAVRDRRQRLTQRQLAGGVVPLSPTTDAALIGRVTDRVHGPSSSTTSFVDRTLINAVERRTVVWGAAAQASSTPRAATRTVRQTAERVPTVHARREPKPAAALVNSRVVGTAAVQDRRPSWMSPSLTHAAPQAVRTTANGNESHRTSARELQPAPARPTPATPPSAPPINIERLSEEVYRQLQKRARIERERTGR
jgi:hypothetical protein